MSFQNYRSHLGMRSPTSQCFLKNVSLIEWRWLLMQIETSVLKKIIKILT